jgi:hypothetical protein
MWRTAARTQNAKPLVTNACAFAPLGSLVDPQIPYDGLRLWSQFHFGEDPFFLLHSPHPTRRHSSRCGQTRRYHTGRVLLVDILSDILHVASFSLRYSPPSTPPPSSSLTWYSLCRIVHLSRVSGLLSRANHVTKLPRMVVASYSPSYSPRLTRYRPRRRRCHQHRTRHVYWTTSRCFCHSERYANHVRRSSLLLSRLARRHTPRHTRRALVTILLAAVVFIDMLLLKSCRATSCCSCRAEEGPRSLLFR